MNSVELDQVTKEYPDAEGRESRRVLQSVSLVVSQGETLAVVGPSGCGKSTLLNLMGLLDEPTSGEVKLAGKKVAGLSASQKAKLRASHVGFVFQLHHLLPQCTALENVLIPTLALTLDKDARSRALDRARALLRRVGLDEHEQKRPAELSGGERQRVAVVRALINSPKLVLADEPTGSLDADRGRELIDLLLELNRETQSSLVLVTHDATIASRLERVLRLSER
ncbi:MAG: ABC transporter ATP-binding protein [Verrucomicrobiales bacterium]